MHSYGICSQISNTSLSRQTCQTQARLFIKKQSDQAGMHTNLLFNDCLLTDNGDPAQADLAFSVQIRSKEQFLPVCSIGRLKLYLIWLAYAVQPPL